jgi:hypothetical protein
LKTLQKTLRKILTREEFVEKFYSKSKSSGLKSVITSVLRVFDDFCLKVYGNDAEKLLGDLRENSMGDALYNFLQDFINYMEEKNLKPKTIASYFNTFRTSCTFCNASSVASSGFTNVIYSFDLYFSIWQIAFVMIIINSLVIIFFL